MSLNVLRMKTLLYFFLILTYKALTIGGALEDSVEFGNYVFETYTDQGKYEDAETFCNDKSGWIAEPVNSTLNDALTGIVQNKKPCWIGLRNNGSVWKWEQDGSVVGTKIGDTADCTDGYCNWERTNGYNDPENYAAITPTGVWIDVVTTNTKNFACQYGCFDTCKNGGTCTSLIDAPYYRCSCLDGYYGKSCESTFQDSVAFGSYVFKTFTGVGKYGDANSLCKDDGGWIAEPTNADLNVALKEIVDAGETPWIGLRNNGSVWKWEQDESVVGTKIGDTADCTGGYCNWYDKDGYNDNETYTAITYSGKWIDINNESPLQFACQYACNCQNGGTCDPLNTDPHYTCDCPDALTGSDCESCIAGTCQNGGTCIPSNTAPDYYTCNCPVALTGTNCESCIAGTCQNGGTCNPTDTGPNYYTCDCPAVLTGNNCETCITGTCQNGGTCNPSETTTNHYNCTCTNAYYGTNCENDYCESYPCENGGTCSPSEIASNYYNCTCADGYYGTNCGESYCDEYPCENGGNCSIVSSDPYYNCTCLDAYFGDNCNESYCDDNPCENEGVCAVRTSKPYYNCTCPDAYFGYNCNESYCDDNPCENEGSCSITSPEPYYNCTCPDAFFGYNCNGNSSTLIMHMIIEM